MRPVAWEMGVSRGGGGESDDFVGRVVSMLMDAGGGLVAVVGFVLILVSVVRTWLRLNYL